MASLRNLKKDINFLATELLSEAYVKQIIGENVDQDALAKLMVQAVELRNELISRANHPNGKDNPKIIKDYFRILRKELISKYLDIVDEINKL